MLLSPVCLTPQFYREQAIFFVITDLVYSSADVRNGFIHGDGLLDSLVSSKHECALMLLVIKESLKLRVTSICKI